MFAKLLNPFRRHGQLKPSTTSSVLKLVHPGGRVEHYNTPMSASKLMERYPSFLITKPNVFKQPLDAIIRPEDTLFPGQKFYIVPQKTVMKLCRRFHKLNTNLTTRSNVATSESGTRSGEVEKAKKWFGIDESGDCDRRLSFGKFVSEGMRRRRSGGKKVVQVAAWHPALESISEI